MSVEDGPMPDLHSRVCYKYLAVRPWCNGAKVQQKVALKLFEKTIAGAGN